METGSLDPSEHGRELAVCQVLVPVLLDALIEFGTSAE